MLAKTCVRGESAGQAFAGGLLNGPRHCATTLLDLKPEAFSKGSQKPEPGAFHSASVGTLPESAFLFTMPRSPSNLAICNGAVEKVLQRLLTKLCAEKLAAPAAEPRCSRRSVRSAGNLHSHRLTEVPQNTVLSLDFSFCCIN